MIRRWFFIEKDAMSFCDQSKIEPKFFKIIIAFFFTPSTMEKQVLMKHLIEKLLMI